MTDKTPQTESTRATEPKAQEPKAQEPTTRHRYDDPMLGPKEFLLAVMHDKHAPLKVRMDAANKLLRIVYIQGDYLRGEWGREPGVGYVIPDMKLQ